MAYELRVSGRAEGRYENSDAAEERARAIIRGDADSIVEIIDLTTGRPYAPGAGAQERDEMARKIGF